MTSSTIAPAIEQSYIQDFMNQYHHLSQMKTAPLVGLPAIKYVPMKGTTNMSRLGRQKLKEVTGERNPDKQYSEMTNDNRRSVTRAFTSTIIVDGLDKVYNLIKDPTSDLMELLVNAEKRTSSQVIIDAAIADVTVGAPDTAGTTYTAAQDGVLTINATAGMSYAKITESRLRFGNNEALTGARTLLTSYTEENDLLNDEKFINSDYTAYDAVDSGSRDNFSGLQLVTFAGTSTGFDVPSDLYLPESGGVRTNLVLAADSILYGTEIVRLDVERNPNKVNSYDITVEVVYKALRTEGVKIQKMTSTIK